MEQNRNPKIHKTILSMILETKIPRNGVFQITESMLSEYVDTYGKINSIKNKNNHDYRLSRKMAGVALLRENYSRGATYSEIKSGLIYLIENPCFPEHYKIGMTVDLNSRLKTYQTYDPYRKFKVAHYDFVLNRSHAEDIILNSFSISIENGEWAKKENCLEVLRRVVKF